MVIYLAKIELCSHEVRVDAKLIQSTIRLHITTTCPRVQKYAEKLKEVNITDIAKPIPDNPVYTLARGLSATCVVPCVILNACWAEAGLIAKSLLKERPRVVIEYKEN
jgi:hypothetical protein